ncbi:MAG: carbohydrate ABC transporter permease [Bifidobacterium asteroides]
MKHRSTWRKTLIAVVFTLIMLFPIYWMINISLTKRRSIRSGDLYPRDFTLANFSSAFHTEMTYLGTSLLIAIGVVLLTLAIALPSSYAIAFLELKGRRTINFLLIVAQMIPAVVMALGFYQIYNRIGLLDSIPGLIIADSTVAVPFAVMLLSSFMTGMPHSIIEAAEIDGASHWRVFTTIVVPLSRNSIVTTSLFSFLWAWSDFMFASTLDSGGGRMRPITMGLYDFIGAQNQEWGPLMATAVLASVPTAVLLIVAQKYVAAGVAAGAIKD